MALSTEERDQVWKAVMRIGTGEPWAVVKADIRAAVDAADDWATANAASFNTALPSAFKTSATAAQKAMLLGLICALRAGRPLPEGL